MHAFEKIFPADDFALLALILGMPLLGAFVNGVFGKRLGKDAVRLMALSALGVAFLGSVLTFFLLHAAQTGGEGGGEQAARFVWHGWQWLDLSRANEAGLIHSGAAPSMLQLEMAFSVDALSGTMALIVTGVGFLIHLYSTSYMENDPGYYRFFAYLNLFIFSMLVLILGHSLPILFIGWEGVGLCSYLLIGFWFDQSANASAGKKAFVVNRIGDFGLLVAMALLIRYTGALDWDGMARGSRGLMTEIPIWNGHLFPASFPSFLTESHSVTVATLVGLSLFLGCAGKSAQFPLYVWLPDAMAGPTPVSALIHAATMVTAGVYLVCRMAGIFTLSPAAMFVVACIGAFTALFAATIALKQWDIKKVLAYSTISQLGYMFVGVGTGAISAGVFHLSTHAFFKALLFLGSGSVIFAMHRAYHHAHLHDDAQDMRNMGGLRRWMPWTSALMWIATLAIAGIPPFSGFFSKDEILAAAFARGTAQPIWLLFWALGLIAALLTAFYMTRMMLYTFHGPNRTGDGAREHLHEAPWIMTGPLVVLGLLSVAGGLLNIPELYKGSAWLHHWLEPVTAPGAALLPATHVSQGTEWILVGVAVAVAITGIVGAWRLLKPEELVPAARSPEEHGFERILRNKWYVDEIYDALIVRPLVWFSREVLWKRIDQGAIDAGAVNGAARGARAAGWANRWLQTGQVGVYVAAFVVGVLLLLWRAVGGGS